ncbi:hypothetical protein SEVIR_2G108800v4 [Setaria viridis]|uniref:Uncharacterized protein n=1 Tax=Setaria viridis TaxID=4556 RepID=A0A4U6W270_SETVI|nr:hypothetical protein SEVIR_2G108800v2 [Setaria viridis]
MILAMLDVGRHRKKAVSNVSGTSSPEELAILSITDKLEGLQLGSPGLSGAAIDIHNEMLSLPSLVMRCILLCRGILGVMSIARAEDMKETLELPIFSFDDLTYSGHNKGAGMSAHTSIPPRVTDPIYLLPMFIRSLLYLDLSSCSGLTQLPPSIGNLHNLAALNLSDCYSLQTLRCH